MKCWNWVTHPTYHQYLKEIETEKTHNGYFSIDKKNRFVDSKVKRGDEGADDASAYDLICGTRKDCFRSTTLSDSSEVVGQATGVGPRWKRMGQQSQGRHHPAPGGQVPHGGSCLFH